MLQVVGRQDRVPQRSRRTQPWAGLAAHTVQYKMFFLRPHNAVEIGTARSSTRTHARTHACKFGGMRVRLAVFMYRKMDREHYSGLGRIIAAGKKEKGYEFPQTPALFHWFGRISAAKSIMSIR